MRNLHELDKYRDIDDELRVYGQIGNRSSGVFRVPYAPSKMILVVIASSGYGWDHVSVSLNHRCPVWDEMEYIKRLFFEDGETAMQLHVAVKDHISRHPYVLHLWRPQHQEIPRPPLIMVG